MGFRISSFAVLVFRTAHGPRRVVEIMWVTAGVTLYHVYCLYAAREAPCTAISGYHHRLGRIPRVPAPCSFMENLHRPHVGQVHLTAVAGSTLLTACTHQDIFLKETFDNTSKMTMRYVTTLEWQFKAG